MNQQRKKQISNLVNQLEALKSKIELIKEDEEEYMENMPENLQSGKQYERAETAVDSMDDAISDIENVLYTLTSIE